MFFDSHAHLDDRRFDRDRQALIESLPQRGISYVINVGPIWSPPKNQLNWPSNIPSYTLLWGASP